MATARTATVEVAVSKEPEAAEPGKAWESATEVAVDAGAAAADTHVVLDHAAQKKADICRNVVFVASEVRAAPWGGGTSLSRAQDVPNATLPSSKLTPLDASGPTCTCVHMRDHAVRAVEQDGRPG